MNFNRLIVPALALLLGATGLSTAKASGMSLSAANPEFGQERGGWDTPPQELREIQRRGFRDGIEGARKDFGNNRQPDVNNREEYRNPSLPRGDWEAYREGFRRGYQTGMSHLAAAPEQPMPVPEQQMRGPERGGWDAPPQEFREIQRRGFQDGIEGARKDFGNHRPPDVNNREEYRFANFPPGDLQAYREGFRRGYDVGMSHLMADAGPQVREPERPWDAPPQEFREIQRRGFQDGIEGARKDFGNHRRPDVNNREEYRYANLPPGDLEAYREGFRRGYERGVAQFWGDRR